MWTLFCHNQCAFLAVIVSICVQPKSPTPRNKLVKLTYDQCDSFQTSAVEDIFSLFTYISHHMIIVVVRRGFHTHKCNLMKQSIWVVYNFIINHLYNCSLKINVNNDFHLLHSLSNDLNAYQILWSSDMSFWMDTIRRKLLLNPSSIQPCQWRYTW